MKLLDCRLGMSCSRGRQQAEVHMEQIELTVLVGEGEVVVATMGAISDIDHTAIHASKSETCMPAFETFKVYFVLLNQPCLLQA